MRRPILFVIVVAGLLAALAFAGIAGANGLMTLPRGPVKSVEKAALYEKAFSEHANLAELSREVSDQAEGLHYPERCQSCHNFSNSCESCHWKDTPNARHRQFGMDCSACHQPPESGEGALVGWVHGYADHNEDTFSECQSCHEMDRPRDHYTGNCSSCHLPVNGGDDTGWHSGHFNHEGELAQDCNTCHELIRPANHYDGQCSACHVAGTAWDQGRFNHQNAEDCRGCHIPLQNHYGGQCSACHQPGSGWNQASFNHKGAGNCQACHNPPRNHFSGECKQCHNPDVSWGRANLRWHRFSLNHGGANGNCSTCHTNNGMNCTSCHENEGEDDDDHGGDDD